MTDSTITQHIKYLERRNAEPTTIRVRRWKLQRLHQHIGKPLLDATESDLDEWQRSLRVSASSIQTYTSHIRAFYEWASDQELIDRNPARKLALPKIKRRLPRPIPEKELEHALLSSRYDHRLFCWFLLAGYIGLRAVEISRISREDFLHTDDGGAYLTVHGKGSKDRVVRVPPEIMAELQPFLITRRGLLFRTQRDTPFDANRVTKIAADHLRGIGLPYTLHTLRHRFATALYDICKDPRYVQEALGHGSLATTQLYVAADARTGASHTDKLSAGLRAMQKRHKPSRVAKKE